MSNKYKVLIAIVLLATAYATGRYMAPEKVKTEVKIVEVDRKTSTTDTNTNKHKETKVTETVLPDGTKKTETTTIEDSNRQSDRTSVTDSKKTETDKTEIVKSSSHLVVSALLGADFSNSTQVYGASATKNLIGPITLGAWGLSNATGGFSIGLSF